MSRTICCTGGAISFRRIESTVFIVASGNPTQPSICMVTSVAAFPGLYVHEQLPRWRITTNIHTDYYVDALTQDKAEATFQHIYPFLKIKTISLDDSWLEQHFPHYCASLQRQRQPH